MIKTAVVLMFIVLFIPVVVFGAEGQPFKALQEQIDQLKIQLQNIQLTPGPKGDKGDPGPQGIQGLQGPAGGFDPSKIYRVVKWNQNTYWATCNSGDLALSGTAICAQGGFALYATEILDYYWVPGQEVPLPCSVPCTYYAACHGDPPTFEPAHAPLEIDVWCYKLD